MNMQTLLNEHDSHYAAQAIMNRINDMPHLVIEVFKPRIFPDGNQWCCLYGENIQEGICGFGDTPALAANDFVKNYHGQKISGNRGRPKPFEDCEKLVDELIIKTREIKNNL